MSQRCRICLITDSNARLISMHCLKSEDALNYEKLTKIKVNYAIL